MVKQFFRMGEKHGVKVFQLEIKNCFMLSAIRKLSGIFSVVSIKCK